MGDGEISGRFMIENNSRILLLFATISSCQAPARAHPISCEDISPPISCEVRGSSALRRIGVMKCLRRPRLEHNTQEPEKIVIIRPTSPPLSFLQGLARQIRR